MPAKDPDYYKKYYQKNKEHLAAYHKEWRAANKEKDQVRIRNWQKDNPEKHRAYCKKWEQNNKGNLRAKVRRRQLRTTQSVYAKYFKNELDNIYSHCPDGWHVDHVIPLVHPNVCGLHVPWNLQYLTAQENYKKGNKYV